MNDLFQRNAPRLTDDEDRRAWERVHRAVSAPAPWWRALWARPAVRFGLPAVAVVLVAVVWIALEQPGSTRAPHPPARAPRAEAPVATSAPPVPAPAASAPAREPAPGTARFAGPPPAGPPAAAPATRARALAAPAAPAPANEPARDEAGAGAPVPMPAPAPGAEGPRAASPAPSAAAENVAPQAQGLAPVIGGAGRDAPAGKLPAFSALRSTTPETSAAPAAPGAAAAPRLATPLLEAVAARLAPAEMTAIAMLPFETERDSQARVVARIVRTAAGATRAEEATRADLYDHRNDQPLPNAYVRFDDAPTAAQILFLAYAADRAMAPTGNAGAIPFIAARARALADAPGDKGDAARYLVSRLERRFGGATYR